MNSWGQVNRGLAQGMFDGARIRGKNGPSDLGVLWKHCLETLLQALDGVAMCLPVERDTMRFFEISRWLSLFSLNVSLKKHNPSP
jgi:hypothetical protein